MYCVHEERLDEMKNILHSIELTVMKIDGKVDKQKTLCEQIQRAKKT